MGYPCLPCDLISGTHLIPDLKGYNRGLMILQSDYLQPIGQEVLFYF